MTIPVFIIGPSKAGKTWITNHLADVSESLNRGYRETVGVRILEISKVLNISRRDVQVDLELWDCSGNPIFRSALPGVTKDAIALIYVTNTDQDQDLIEW